MDYKLMCFGTCNASNIRCQNCVDNTSCSFETGLNKLKKEKEFENEKDENIKN